MDPVKNFAKVTVGTGYSAGATSITLQTGHGAKLPNPAAAGAFNLVWWNFTDYPDPSDDGSVEIVRCTARATDVLTVTRAQESTSDVDHNITGKTYLMLLACTKKQMDDIDSEKLANVVEDTTPQAGGNFDLQTNKLVGEGGTEGLYVDSAGNVGIGATLLGAKAQINADASGVGLIVRAHASPPTPGNIQEWQDGAGSILARIARWGYLHTTTGYTNTKIALGYDTTNQLKLTSDSPAQWSSVTIIGVGNIDTSISRLSAAKLGIGSGTLGDYSGTLITGDAGVGTLNPGNPLAVNRATDGIIVDFESADIVEGNVSISGNTTSYNAFVGSHYTQLKTGQKELPVGAVVISTGEIISCSVAEEKERKVSGPEAYDIIEKKNAIEEVETEVEDTDNIVSEDVTYSFDPETEETNEIHTPVYGMKNIWKKQLKKDVQFNNKTAEFFSLKPKVRYDSDKDEYYLSETFVKEVPNKEYFSYINTTNKIGNEAVYGVWLGKLSDDAKGASFGQDDKPVYLIAQVGLFKIRVTDTNGDITNGDYLETSSRPMEAQKQSSAQKLNSTLAKALTDVDWSKESIDPLLGYKWKLIPGIF